MRLCTDIHGAQMINPTNISDPLTFTLAPPRLTFVDFSEMSLTIR